MTMNVKVAQVRLAREVREAESALNDALLKQSNLFTTMLTARRDTGVGCFTGQDALMRLAHSQQSLITAGGDLARVHGKLSNIGSEVTGAADDILCPPEHFGAPTIPHGSNIKAA